MKDESKNEIIDFSADVVGGTVGGFIGASIAGPLGLLIGSVGSATTIKAIKCIAGEMSKRLLSKREEIKISNALTCAINSLNENIKRGKLIRTDDFFDNTMNDRSSAEEILEAILYKVQREPEERKIPYIGNIFANVVFDTEIFPELAHQVVKVAEQLSYRQLCLLKIFSGFTQLDLRKSDYRSVNSFDSQLYSILYECYDLYIKGLIANGGVAMLGPNDFIPAIAYVQGVGANCFYLMELDKIPDDDLKKYIDILKR